MYAACHEEIVGSHTQSDSLLTQAGALTATRDPANGLLTSTTLDTVSTAWTYNGFGEPAAYEATDGANSLFREEMERDLLGRVTQKRETFGRATTVTDYGYDETGRLVWADIDGVRAATWTYDSNDNRLTEVTSSGSTSGTYDDQDRLLSYGSSTYTWNDDGDLATRTTSGFVETFDYDVFGNLVTYSSPSIDIEYVIDGQNRRVGKKINGTLVQGFLYVAQLYPVAELDGSGNVVSVFVHGTRPSTPDYMLRNGDTYQMVSDHLGSVRLVVNSADGTIAQRIDYDAWGNVVYDSNPGFQPFGFAGGIYDRHTGLTRFGARDYDPDTGRRTSKDPTLFAGGHTNRYGYVYGDPVNLIDPLGRGGCAVNFPGYPITIPGTDIEVPLNHAGILAYDDEGNTRYYEFGRYPEFGDRGGVRRRAIPDLDPGPEGELPDGQMTEDSWDRLKDALQEGPGAGHKPFLQCDEDADFQKVVDFAEETMNDPNREPYSWNPLKPNTCATFAREALQAGRE